MKMSQRTAAYLVQHELPATARWISKTTNKYVAVRKSERLKVQSSGADYEGLVRVDARNDLLSTGIFNELLSLDTMG
jgi:hypothetical protein